MHGLWMLLLVSVGLMVYTCEREGPGFLLIAGLLGFAISGISLIVAYCHQLGI